MQNTYRQTWNITCTSTPIDAAPTTYLFSPPGLNGLGKDNARRDKKHSSLGRHLNFDEIWSFSREWLTTKQNRFVWRTKTLYESMLTKITADMWLYARIQQLYIKMIMGTQLVVKPFTFYQLNSDQYQQTHYVHSVSEFFIWDHSYLIGPEWSIDVFPPDIPFTRPWIR